ncbi:E-selectin-like [Branchiostoma floridae x Branchiostoma belcheri]
MDPRNKRLLTISARPCQTLTPPTNGAFTLGHEAFPIVVTFTCNPGYVLNGAASTLCQNDGTLTNPVPTCTPVQCPSLTAPTNGAVSPAGAVSYPNSVTSTCNSGYTRNGAAAATCQADGTWSSPVPTCTPVQCPALTAPANGAVTPTGAVSYPNGVTFTCNTGYVLNGAAAATCQADGTWSNPAPTCTHLDKCTENMETCPDGSICLNTPGGYRCTYCTPEVAILGGGMNITRSVAFRLTSRLSLGANCTEQLDDVAYQWEALPPAGTRWQVLADIVSAKADLLVPSKTLDYGTYMFRLTVTLNETNTGVVVSTTSNTVSVSITASSLVAGILGGFRRQVGTGRVTLDAATLSSDPDGVISMSKDLNYHWSCHSTDGSCPVLNGGVNGLLTVNLGLGTLHSELTFTVEVSAPGRDAVSASQIVNVVRSTIPLTSVM